MVKLKDIAQATGLTVSTVSKALNHSKEISAETSRRVLETARSLGYISKRDVNEKIKVIGVILPEVNSHYYASLMQCLSREFEKRGYQMLTMLMQDFSSSVGPYIDRMCRFELSGMIVGCIASISQEDYQIIRRSGIPALMLNERSMIFPMVDSIHVSISYAVELAVEHLIGLGHREIGYLGEYNSDGRYQAFCECMKKNQQEINPRFVKRTGTRFEEGGYELAGELMKEEKLPTAVVACYDQVAFGIMRAFQEKGIRVPEDISVVGFDNIIMDDYCSVPLTSVVNPVEQLGVTAVKILLDAVENGNEHIVQNVSLQSRLVVRNSTCPPRKPEASE